MAKTEVAKGSESSVSRPRDFFSAMRDEMDHVFDQFERGFLRRPSPWRRDAGGSALMSPELDVRENPDAITIEAELPGVDEKDISVTVANGMLTIKGEKKQEKEERNENYYLAERRIEIKKA